MGISEPKLINLFLDCTARDSQSTPSESSPAQRAMVAHGCHGKHHLSEPPTNRKRWQEVAKPLPLLSPVITSLNRTHSGSLFPVPFSSLVFPPSAHQDVSLESFQPSLQILKFREFLKGSSLAQGSSQ